MSKYSSDSNSSEDSRYQKRKSKRRSRSSSSSSNDSRYSKKRSYKHKRSKGHRSRSRDKYSKSRSRYSRDDSSRSMFGSRSRSKVKHRKTSHDRSHSDSRERSSGKRKHRSKRCSRSPSKSHSKHRSGSSSSSSNYRFRSRSNSPISLDSRNVSQTGSSKQEPSSEEQLRAKLQQAIKAAQSADDLLRQQGFLTGVSIRKEEIVKEPTTTILDEINSPGFIPKNFVSQSSISFSTDSACNAVSKATSGPSAAPPALVKNTISSTSIFHPSLMVDTDQKLDKWVKKLFSLRQKAINGEPIA